MAETIVMFQKYSTLVTGTYYSDPYDVTSFKTISVELFYAAGNATTFTGQMQESSDLETWTDTGSALQPSAGAVASADYQNTARYLRLKITTTGADKVVTIWAKAVAREN